MNEDEFHAIIGIVLIIIAAVIIFSGCAGVRAKLAPWVAPSCDITMYKGADGRLTISDPCVEMPMRDHWD